MGRAAGNATIGQVGGAGPELDLFDVEPEPIGGDLRQRGPGALAHVVRPDLHHAATVPAQHGLGLRLKHERGKRGRAHAPADQQSGGVAHLPRRKWTALPAEALGTLPVTLAQRLRGERLARDRLDVGIVLEPERQRIDAAGIRHLVNGALERDRAGRFPRRAHEERRADVDPDRFMRRGDGATRVERMRDVGGRLEEVVEGARHGLGPMLERGQLAAIVGADPQGLTGRRPVSHRAVHLLAAQHQLHRLSHHARRHDAEDLRS